MDRGLGEATKTWYSRLKAWHVDNPVNLFYANPFVEVDAMSSFVSFLPCSHCARCSSISLCYHDETLGRHVGHTVPDYPQSSV